jgi:catechol 2,3-dioxygenase-like lactoylglutathione lyase family enzyme
MSKVFECDDGYVARGEDDDALVADVLRHVTERHPDLVGKLAREEILASAREEAAVLGGCRVHAALPASDLARARRFYADALGMEPVEERAAGLRYDCGGTALLVFPTPVAARGGHTQAGFEVPDIAAAVARLRSRGVALERDDAPHGAGESGIVTVPDGSRAAWFKDSEDNLIALVQLI